MRDAAAAPGRTRLGSVCSRAGFGIHVAPKDVGSFRAHQADMLERSYNKLVRSSAVLAVAIFLLFVVAEVSMGPLPSANPESRSQQDNIELQSVFTAVLLIMPGFWLLSKCDLAQRSFALLACTSQVVVLVLMLGVAAEVARQARGVVQQHGIFACSFNNIMSTFTFAGYVPLVVQVIAAVLGMAVWLYFHIKLQLAHTTVVVYGACIVVLSVVFGSLQRSALWNEFKATQELERERHLLEDVQRTLDRVLSTFFDASCTCDVSGAMLTGTPQLQQLLGVNWDSGTKHLWDFSPSDKERGRLLAFLKAVAADGDQQMQILRTVVRTANTNAEINADVFGIRLPDRDGRGIAFIGLRGARIAEQFDVPTADAIIDRMTVGKDCSRTESTSMGPSSPMLDEGVETVAAADAPAAIAAAEAATEGAAKAASYQETIPEDCVGSSSPNTRGTYRSTSVLAGMPFSAMGVQPTIGSASMSTASLGASRTWSRGRNPNGLRNRRTDNSKSADAHEGTGGFVVLKTSKKLLQGFKETPSETVRYLVLSALMQFNSRGRGCCSLHVQVAIVLKLVTELAKGACNPQFRLLSRYQCACCLCLMDPQDEDDEDDGPPICSLCGSSETTVSDCSGSEGS